MYKPSFCVSPRDWLCSILRGRAQAAASITGSSHYPGLSGEVRFFQTGSGVIVCAGICGLPQDGGPCHERIFGFHIHEGTECGGPAEDPFAHAMSHYNPGGCEHPRHAGDLPPLFGNDGTAVSLFLTSRFSVEDVIGKTVIIHDSPDDFTTGPSGNAGEKIACGVIRKTEMSCG